MAYSFFIGAILSAEVSYIMRSCAKRVVVGGNKYLKDAIVLLLREHTTKEIESISPDDAENAVALGLVKIFEYDK